MRFPMYGVNRGPATRGPSIHTSYSPSHPHTRLDNLSNIQPFNRLRTNIALEENIGRHHSMIGNDISLCIMHQGPSKSTESG